MVTVERRCHRVLACRTRARIPTRRPQQESGGVDTQIQAITDGEVDLIDAGFQPQLAQLLGREGIATESKTPFSFEHLEFHLGSTEMPLLREPWFREAVAFALDRGALVTELFGETHPDLEPLHSLLYSSGQPEYEPNFGDYVYSPKRVTQLMLDNGCELGGDGIWVCAGVRASVELATTTGNARRALAQEEMQAQAAAAGIELVPDNSPAGHLLGTRLPTMDFELIMFTWLGSGDPAGWRQIYGCPQGSPGVQNFTGYCSKKVTDVLAQSDAELDPQTRSSLVNKADKVLARDLPSFPLYSTPTFIAYTTMLHGPMDNPSLEGPTWNVADWWIE